MDIMIQQVRVYGFRGLKNIEVDLEPFTILTGINNVGKTTFLKAIQLVFGNISFVTNDDFNIDLEDDKIIVDVKIVPFNKNKKFSDKWQEYFGIESVKFDLNNEDQELIPVRSVISVDPVSTNITRKQYVLMEWPSFDEWYKKGNDNKNIKSFGSESLPFFYIDAKRDIVEDLKLQKSYLGRVLSKISYSDKDVKAIEKSIEELNRQTVESSDILRQLEKSLEGIESAIGTHQQGVHITPFSKKVRDLNKGVSIQYDNYSIEYHGMGTRCWSSLLSYKSFIGISELVAKKEDRLFFPISAIEESEAHLHPSAQKKLFGQVSKMKGQVILSTHSPYVVGAAELKQIRGFYKDETDVKCGRIDTELFDREDIRKIKRQVVNTRGELFFSKVIVLFEGETEEQALPLFAEKYFEKCMCELEIDFVGVGGAGNYLPFMRFAESFNIPWFIFSDAEDEIIRGVKNQFKQIDTASSFNEHIVVLKKGNSFEKELIDEGYIEEFKKAVLSLQDYTNDQHKAAKAQEIQEYSKEKLVNEALKNKTKMAPVLAFEIIDSKKSLPSKVVTLFEKIEEVITSKKNKG
ncbi:MAG: ATP-dependent endonuclease [Hyphomicrobiales bacterium]